MPTPVLPVTKAVYLCDDAIEDQTSRKVNVLGVFNAVRIPPSVLFPVRLGQLCIFAQMIGGIGEVSTHVEIVDAENEEVVYAFPEQRLQFPNRQLTISALFRIQNCLFSHPGEYIVELYCQGIWIDDRMFHVLVDEEEEL